MTDKKTDNPLNEPAASFHMRVIDVVRHTSEEQYTQREISAALRCFARAIPAARERWPGRLPE